MTTKPLTSLKALRSAGKIGSRDLYQIDVRDFVVIPGQSGRNETTPRFKESVSALTEFMRNGGKVPPIEFRLNGDKIEVAQGHRRRLAFLDYLPEVIKAAEEAKLSEDKIAKLWRVDAIPFEGNDLDLVARQVTGNEHLALTAMELASNYELLRTKFKLSVADICRHVNKDRFHVDTHLALASAPHALQQAVDDDLIKPTEAAKLFKEYGQAAGEHIEQLATQAKAQGKKRITSGVTGGRSLPKPLVNDLRDRVTNFVDKLPKATRNTVEHYRKDPDQYDPDEYVQVPLALLAGVMASHGNVIDKMAELDAKDAARAAANKQAGDSTNSSDDDF